MAFVAFLSAQIPVVLLLGFLLVSDAPPTLGRILLVALAGVLFGTCVCLWCLHQLFRPVQFAIKALREYLETGKSTPLPEHFRDEVGELLRNTNYALQVFRERNQLLEQVAVKDFLTGLLNRRAADERLREGLSLVQREDRKLVMALLDIDRFKRINDVHGHAAGDEVLIQVAQLLRLNLRGGDWSARWGGDEFLVVLHCAADGAQEALERVRILVEELKVMVSDGEVRLTASIGYTDVLREDRLEACIERADEALYLAKSQGRNLLLYGGASSRSHGSRPGELSGPR